MTGATTGSGKRIAMGLVLADTGGKRSGFPAMALTSSPSTAEDVRSRIEILDAFADLPARLGA